MRLFLSTETPKVRFGFTFKSRPAENEDLGESKPTLPGVKVVSLSNLNKYFRSEHK